MSVVGLAPDRWRWRLRAGAAPLAALVVNHIAIAGIPDVVVVSSPLDAARLIGLLRRELRGVPVVLYQHESQLLYPNPRGPAATDTDALHDWFAWLAVDAVWFNSDWHRRAVIDALPAFVARFPDADHRSRLDSVVAKFETLPLGLDLAWAAPAERARPVGAPIIVWPHRWEADKDPSAFARAVERLAAAGSEFRLVLAGDTGPSQDGARVRLVSRLADRIIAVGPFDRQTYRHWLLRSDVVVSCARHDFFGVGVAEAVAAGCVPVVPDALHYPELLGDDGRPFLYRPGTFGRQLAAVIGDLGSWRPPLQPVADAMHRFDWSTMAPIYDRRLTELLR